MPNWCSNDLYIYGDARKDIADFISGPEGVIDFEKITPMPEVLKETSHGSEEQEAVFEGASGQRVLQVSSVSGACDEGAHGANF